MHRQCYEYVKRDLGTGDLCDNIGLVGISAKWSYVTGHHDQTIPILSPLIFMHVGHPYIPLFKSRRNFNLLVDLSVMGDTSFQPSDHKDKQFRSITATLCTSLLANWVSNIKRKF